MEIFIKGSIKTNFPLLGVDNKENIYFLDEKITEDLNIEYFILKTFSQIIQFFIYLVGIK